MSRQHNDGSCDKPRAPKSGRVDVSQLIKREFAGDKDTAPFVLYGNTEADIERQLKQIRPPVLNNTMVSG